MTSSRREHDVVVIGGGAAGIGAAREAARRRARVLLVQDGPIGGDCTFTGCVPSKAVIEAAARGDRFEDAMLHARRAIASIASTEDDAAMRGQGIDVIHGRATFRSAREIDVGGRSVRSRRFVVATGSMPTVPEIDGVDQARYVTNETVFELRRCPASLAVLGGGAVGCELAQAFGRLGAAVTIVEEEDRLLPGEDRDASDVMSRVFEREGVRAVPGRGLGSVARRSDREIELVLDDGQTLRAEQLLVAVGRRPATDGLGLDQAGVRTTEAGHVRVDARLRTSAAGVYAAGDVSGVMLFTHAAFDMGRIAAANALSRTGWRRFRTDAVPWVTFTDPEVARVGITEEDAPAGARVAEVPLAEVDRAIVAGARDGFVKLIAGPRSLTRYAAGGRVLGATIVAPRAGEMIHEIALAMRANLFAGRLAQTVHAYPTWSVAIRQAAAKLVLGGTRAPHGGSREETLMAERGPIVEGPRR
jgi:pyruvate/2-oxoglutarate dehydrogenase complex dihydrolipoamide dehydrogenase (E3) component